MLDDVWEASVVEAFETVGLSLLVTTREVFIYRVLSCLMCRTAVLGSVRCWGWCWGWSYVRGELCVCVCFFLNIFDVSFAVGGFFVDGTGTQYGK